MSTISVVVPMYNEEDRIEKAVRALLSQSVPFLEVIVVDNGSTDQSISRVEAIARTNPTVRLLHETRPGCFAARNTGYDAVSSDIIARTDADSVVSSEWASSIVSFLDSEEGAEFDAVTGPVVPYDAPPFRFVTKIARGVHDRGECGAVHGPNHALRVSAWKRCRSTVTNRADVWEDLDLSIALHDLDSRVFFLPEAEVRTSIRAERRSPIKNWHYVTGGLRTAHARANPLAIRAMRIDLPIRVVTFTGMWLVFRPWDNESKSWRPSRLFRRLENEHADVTRSRD